MAPPRRTVRVAPRLTVSRRARHTASDTNRQSRSRPPPKPWPPRLAWYTIYLARFTRALLCSRQNRGRVAHMSGHLRALSNVQPENWMTSPAAQLPTRQAVSTSFPAAVAARKPPTKASPAPLTSTMVRSARWG